MQGERAGWMVNRERETGAPLTRAIRNAGRKRFRAIFLTSVTTFVGLAPIMFRPTEATFFIVPIAVSLAFGVLMATFITLFIVPCGYQIVDDLQNLVSGRRRPGRFPEPAVAD